MFHMLSVRNFTFSRQLFAHFEFDGSSGSHESWRTVGYAIHRLALCRVKRKPCKHDPGAAIQNGLMQNGKLSCGQENPNLQLFLETLDAASKEGRDHVASY